VITVDLIRDRVDEIIADSVNAAQYDYERAIKTALERYSIDRPAPNKAPQHTVDDDTGETTVYDTDFYHFCYLVASIVCTQLSVKYTHTGEGSFLNASIAIYRTKGMEFRDRAKELMQMYEAYIAQSEAPRNYAYPTGAMGATSQEIVARLAPDVGRRSLWGWLGWSVFRGRSRW